MLNLLMILSNVMLLKIALINYKLILYSLDIILMNSAAATSYYNDNYTFDIKKFNKDFESYLSGQKARRIEREKKFLESKEIVQREKLLHELTIWEIIVNMKITVFNILDDLIDGKVDKEFFTKNNRLFYVGLLILIFCFTLMGLNKLFSNPHDSKKHDDKNITLSVKLDNVVVEHK
jgi:hypothetical protein